MRHASGAAAAAAASAPSWGSDSRTPTAYVYSGPGAGSRSVLSTIYSLREALVPAVQVASLDTAALLAGGWQQQALLLVMPGGADLPYCKHLNGRGNALIKGYVEGGGAYLGLCAGAYYACARVEFEPGSRLEVVGDRELCFFPGTAAGSIYKGFCYQSEGGAVAAPLLFRCIDGGTTRAAEVGGNGGHAVTSSTAASSNASMQCGANGVSRSSRCGTEDGDSLPAASGWQQAVDYVNGGPAFLLPRTPAAKRGDASPSRQTDVDEKQLQQQLQQQAAASNADAEQQPRQRQQQQCAASNAASEQQQGQQQWHELGVEVLATYPEHSGAAAALLCSVGSLGGRAVLCSSHPELHPSWLGGGTPQPWGSGSAGAGGDADEASLSVSDILPVGSADGTCFDGGRRQQDTQASLAAERPSVDDSVRQLQAALLAAQPQRWQLWCSLLAAAGLRGWMQPHS